MTPAEVQVSWFLVENKIFTFLIDWFHQPSDPSRNLNHGETSRTECDQEEGRGDEEEDRHQSQAEEGARPSSRIIIIIIITIDPLQIRGSDLEQEV